MLLGKLKRLKEEKEGENLVLGVFKTRGEAWPVRTYRKWLARESLQEKGMPAFRERRRLLLAEK